MLKRCMTSSRTFRENGQWKRVQLGWRTTSGVICDQSLQLKIKVYKKAVKPTVSYGLKTDKKIKDRSGHVRAEGVEDFLESNKDREG